MKGIKIIVLIMLASLLVGMAHALTYDIVLEAMPNHNDFDGVLVDEDEDFLVFGYIYVNEESDAITPSDLDLVVVDADDDVVDSYTPTFVSKSDYNDFVFDGYFYKEISIDDEGEYLIRLETGDQSKNFKFVNVDNSVVNRNIKISLLDYSVDGDKITFGLKIQNDDTVEQEITVYLMGEKNIDEPETFKVTLDTGKSRTVEKEYDLSDFGSDRFLVVAQAYVEGSEEQELLSSYDYLEVDVGQSYVSRDRQVLEITNVSLNQNVFFSGDLVEGTVSIENHGTVLSQYVFEYVFDNVVFRKGEAGFVEPGQIATEQIFIDMPNQASISVKFKVYNEYSNDELTKTFLVSQRTKYFAIKLDKPTQTVSAGQTVVSDMIVLNTGNQKDSYKVNVSDWEKYSISTETLVDGLIILDAAKQSYFRISFEVPESMRVGDYKPNITVCNSVDKCYNKQLEITVIKPEDEQTGITWNDSFDEINYTELGDFNYTIALMNIGAEKKNYKIEIDAPEGLNYSVSDDAFSLDIDKTKTVDIVLTPINATDYVATLKVFANNEEIFTKEIKLNYDEKAVGGLTGMFLMGVEGIYWPGLTVLALIGIGAVIYSVYAVIQKRVWTEKVLDYTQKHPQRLTRYPGRETY